MGNKDLQSELERIVMDLCSANALEFVEVALQPFSGRLAVKVLIDQRAAASVSTSVPGSIDLSGCDRRKEPDPQQYVIEVSSPGIDRPMRVKADFVRAVGKNAKFFLNRQINGKMEWDGVIISVSDSAVAVDAGTCRLEFPLDSINKAKQLF
jgi:ribosome maturation factor RimP